MFLLSQYNAITYILFNCAMTKKPVDNINTYLYICFLFFINAIEYLETSTKHIFWHC